MIDKMLKMCYNIMGKTFFFFFFFFFFRQDINLFLLRKCGYLMLRVLRKGWAKV